MEYFDHNVNAADDDAVMALRIERGGAAVDCYWALIEKIYRDEGPVVVDGNQPETKALTHRLCVGFDEFEGHVSAMVSTGLLEVVREEPRTVMSRRAQRTIERMRERRETAAQNGKKGGRPTKAKTQQKPNPNQTLTKGKAIKIKEECMERDKPFPIHNGSPGAGGAGPAPRPADDRERVAAMAAAACPMPENLRAVLA